MTAPRRSRPDRNDVLSALDIEGFYASRLDALRPGARGHWEVLCPFHDDRDPSLSIERSTGLFKCFGCGAAGSVFDFEMRLRGVDFATALEHLATEAGLSNGRETRRIAATYDYRDEDGSLLFQAVRYDPKDFSQRRPDGKGGWVWNLTGIRRVSYRLPDLLASPQNVVYVVEGEKDADRLASEGLIGTTNSEGAGKWRPEHSEFLRDRDVVILPDNDKAGRRHSEDVARSLHGVASSVKIVELPGLPEKGDVSDWLGEGHDVGELQALVEAAPEWQPQGEPTPQGESAEEQGKGRPSQADRLVALVESEGVELLHDELGEGFARVPVGSHRELWRCRGKDLRRWLAGRFWHSERKASNSEALTAALNVIESMARFDGDEYQLSNRVARAGNAIWYDLADREWRAVKITPAGWEVIGDTPILFRRHSHQRPQAEPKPGGDLRDVLRFVNIPDNSQGLLLLIYVVCCFVPDIPHPIPVLHGPQGSAKTTLLRMLRALVDPSATAVLSFPRDATQLVQQLSHHWTPFYDNITGLQHWTSDVLCRAVTGEGFSKRELYTDDEDVIYQFRRCVGLNGVNVAASKPDLLDRCILFGLEPISPAHRRPEQEIWQQFEAARPRVVGAVFDTLSRAMALRDSVRVPVLPRMADFALWGCAVAEALGYSHDGFLAAYEGNTETRNEEALQASPVAGMLMELMDRQPEWEGTPTELLAELETLAEQHRVNITSREWPKAPHALSRRLNEVRPNLAAVGIDVQMRRDGRHRMVAVRKVPGNGVTAVTTVTENDGALDLTALPDDDTSSEPGVAALTVSPDESPCSPRGGAGDACDADDATSRVVSEFPGAAVEE
jgi:hypothetical protein